MLIKKNIISFHRINKIIKECKSATNTVLEYRDAGYWKKALITYSLKTLSKGSIIIVVKNSPEYKELTTDSDRGIFVNRLIFEASKEHYQYMSKYIVVNIEEEIDIYIYKMGEGFVRISRNPYT